MKKKIDELQNISSFELHKQNRNELAEQIMFAILTDAIKDLKVTTNSIVSFSFELADEFIKQSNQ